MISNYLGMILLVNVLILVHEAGHFIAAKVVGIPVAGFSVGLGPKLWSRRWRGTEFSLRLLPLGGFVAPGYTDEAEFRAVALAKRIAYFLGGPLANLLACLPLLAVLDTARGGLSLETTLVAPVQELAGVIGQTLAALAAAFSHPQAVSGAVGIVVEGGRLLAGGLAAEVALYLSVSLAVMNLLPIPILDGGQIVLGCLEELWPGLVRWRGPVTLMGLVVLAGLMLYANGHDLSRYLGAG